MAKQSDTTKEKWRKFASYIMIGETKIDAYRKVYGQGTTSNKTLQEKASRLAHKPEVVALLDEMKRANVEASGLERQDTLNALLELQREAKESSRVPIENSSGMVIGYKYNAAAATVAVKCAEAIAKMCGFNEPEKVDSKIEIVIAGDLDDYAQ